LELFPFRFLRNLGRSREIATVLLTYGSGDLVERLHLRRYVQWGKRIFFWRKRGPEPLLTRAERVRLALESLGATFIKFGQVISTRRDLVPADVVNELCKLQEQVPPFSSKVALQIVQTELGRPADELFAAFDEIPLAAGSLGQVHQARLHDGTQVAVKIRRPGILTQIERDLSLMHELAGLIERHVPEAEIFDPVGLVHHFARTIRRELNYRREAQTLDEFSRLFRNDKSIVVPAVYWDFTTESVLTMQLIEGFRITDPEMLTQVPVSPAKLAAQGARIFMKMAFELGVFHGDPHPGNVRVMRDGSICLLDYGMVGRLDDEKREQLVDLFVAITRRDVNTVVDLVEQIGHPYRELDVPLLRADVRDFIENYYGVSLQRLNVGNMLTDFVSILANHGIRCPSDLMLLIRVFITLEGIGRQLDPNFNLAEQLAPFVTQVVKDRYNPKRMAERFAAEMRGLGKLAHEVPRHVARTIEKLSNDDLSLRFEHRGLDRLITEVDRSSNRIIIGMVLSSLIVASALIIRAGADILWFSAPIFIISSLLGAWLIYGIFRSGRL
jgi:ubiquinone biosynthesis protein